MLRACARLVAVGSVALFALLGCASVYTDSSFANYQKTHKQVAVIPFQVNIDLKKLPEGMEYEDIKIMEKNEGYQFQSELISRYLRRSAKGEYTVEFQDASRTNHLLSQAGLSYEDLAVRSKEELAKILGVDAIISGRVRRSKPMSTGAAVASALLIGFSVTNEVSVNMNIHDGESGKLLWNFDHEVSGSLGSSANGIAEALTRASANRFPYKR